MCALLLTGTLSSIVKNTEAILCGLVEREEEKKRIVSRAFPSNAAPQMSVNCHENHQNYLYQDIHSTKIPVHIKQFDCD